MIIEFLSIVVRILIFFYIQSVKIFDQEENAKRKILIKLLLYTLPFTIAGIWIILRRTSNDIDLIIYLSKGLGIQGYCRSEFLLIFTTFHHFLHPMRGLLNALVNFKKF